MGSVEGWILKAGLLAYEDVISRAAVPLYNLANTQSLVEETIGRVWFLQELGY